MNPYSKWLVTGAVTVAGFLTVYVLVCHQAFRTPQFSLWIKNCLEKKITYANRVEGPKVVLLSGSNTLFGIRAADLEARTGVPCVNMAVHYGLQIDYMTERAKDVLRPGDVVILPLEFHHYSYDGEYSLIQSSFIRTYDRAYFEALPLKKRLWHLINTTPLDLFKSLREQSRFEGVESPAGRGIYNSRNLNDHGDETTEEGPLWDRLEREQPVPLLPVSAEGYGFRHLFEFSEWCREHDVTMYVTWPNSMWFEAYKGKEYQRYFSGIRDLLAEKNITLFGDLRKSFFDKDMMYDGKYHLNATGRKLRTRIVAEDLMELLETR